jgi:hypothetical protein
LMLTISAAHGQVLTMRLLLVAWLYGGVVYLRQRQWFLASIGAKLSGSWSFRRANR